MTRLTGADVTAIDSEFLAAHDRRLLDAIGRTLFGLACRAAGLEEAEGRRLVAEIAAAVVPMDCGGGLIPGFAESVRAILVHLGCAARITEHGEVAGLAEAVEGGRELVFTADDYRFVILDLRRRRVVDNAAATAHGFVAGLACLAGRYPVPGRPPPGDLRPAPSASPTSSDLRQPQAGDLRGRQVLVIGCGEVGSAACLRLLEQGARVALYDIKAERAEALAAVARATAPEGVVVEATLAGALERHSLLVEASPAADTIPIEALRPDSLVAAPGVPLGVTVAGASALGGRLLHDPLQTGVATMLMEALRP